MPNDANGMQHPTLDAHEGTEPPVDFLDLIQQLELSAFSKSPLGIGLDVERERGSRAYEMRIRPKNRSTLVHD